MADFLTLCQRARQECGVAGEGPSTVLNQVGVLKKIVDRTRRAWVDIQASKPGWKFLRNQTTYVLTTGTRAYNVSSALGLTTVDKWDKQSAFIYLTSTSDETKLRWMDYQDFRNRLRTYPDGRPTRIIEERNGNIGFDRTPDEDYTITLDYWMTPEALTANTDIPSMPEHYHDAIVWKSVMNFAGNETANELFAYAKSMYDPIFLRLCLDQLDVATSVKAYPIASGVQSSGELIRNPGS